MIAIARLHRSLSWTRQSAVSGLLLGALVVTLVGVPVLPRVQKDLSIPFPCQHHGCGCRDAATCWKSCCCFNHEQKVAWAQRNGVAVPATAKAKEKTAGSCCHKRGQCAAPHDCQQPQTTSVGLVLLDDYQCRTGSALWVMLGHAIPSAVVIAPPTFDAVDYRYQPVVSPLTSVSHRPPSPPPKLA